MTTIEFPEKGFADEIKRYRKRKPTVTLVLHREVVAPVLFRNSSTDRAETHEFGDKLRAQVNPEKFVAKERLTGLDLLRRLSEQFGDENWDEDVSKGETPSELISDEYTHNEPGDLTETLNLGTLTYGVAGTGDQEYGIKSHVYEGYTYSVDEYDIMRKETRNAVYESGTMQNEDGEQASALFDLAKIHPGNSFVHFVTVEAGTPGMFLYVLHNVLNTSKYGARETRAGKTIENNVLGVILGDYDTTLSAAELLSDYYDATGNDIPEALSEYIQDNERADWEVYGDLPDYPDFPEWYEEAHRVAARQSEEADKVLYKYLHGETEQIFDQMIDL